MKRKDWIWVVVLTIIGLLPSISLMIFGSDLRGFFMKSAVFFTISLLLYYTPSLFLKARTFFLVQGIFVLAAPWEIAHIYMNGVPATKAFLLTAFNTNSGEMSELFSSMLPVVIGTAVVWVAYFYITIRKIENRYFIRPLKIRMFLLGAVALVLVVGYGYYYVFHTRHLETSKERYKETNRIYKWKFNKIYPYSFIINLDYTIHEKREINKSSKLLKTISLEAKKKQDNAQCEVYVVVIGETARYNNFSINGYGRPTSPLLEQVENLVSYSDFMSEASLTILSLPTLLTGVTANDFDHYYQKKTFVDAFKEAGFATYWLANQSAENSFIRRIAGDADSHFFSTTDYDANNNHDELLFPYLDQALKADADKKLIVLHTMGSHFKYNFRYPAEFNVFRPSAEENFEASFLNSANKEILVNTYDNSILYTDYFLSRVIGKLDSLDCISTFMFVSDHGENIYDTKENAILHGGKVTTQFDYHIPLFFWFSDEYTEVYPQKTENIIANKDCPLSMSYLYSTILDVGDITYIGENLQRSLASCQLQTDSVRYVLHSDYTVHPLPEKP